MKEEEEVEGLGNVDGREPGRRVLRKFEFFRSSFEFEIVSAYSARMQTTKFKDHMAHRMPISRL